MRKEIELRLQLELPAQQVLSNLRFYNEDVEKQVEDGINLALKELTEHGSLERLVADRVKDTLSITLHKAIMSYEVQSAIQNSITEKVKAKITEYSDKIAENVALHLK